MTVLRPVAARPPGPVDGADARAAARHELDKPAYRSPGPSLPERFMHWVGRQFDRLFAGGGVGSHAFLLVVVLLLVVLAVLVARAGLPGRGTRPVSHPDDADPLAALDSREHRRLAAGFESDGRRAEALREWLRAAVATIEERGVLPARPGRTGAQAAAEAGPLLPDAAEDLSRATTAFDAVWFGGRTAVPDDVAAAHRAADLVRSARIRGDATTSTPVGIAAPW